MNKKKKENTIDLGARIGCFTYCLSLFQCLSRSLSLYLYFFSSLFICPSSTFASVCLSIIVSVSEYACLPPSLSLSLSLYLSLSLSLSLFLPSSPGVRLSHLSSYFLSPYFSVHPSPSLPLCLWIFVCLSINLFL